MENQSSEKGKILRDDYAKKIFQLPKTTPESSSMSYNPEVESLRDNPDIEFILGTLPTYC